MTSAQVVETSVNVITNSSSQLLPTPRWTIIVHKPMSVRPGHNRNMSPELFAVEPAAHYKETALKLRGKKVDFQISKEWKIIQPSL